MRTHVPDIFREHSNFRDSESTKQIKSFCNGFKSQNWKFRADSWNTQKYKIPIQIPMRTHVPDIFREHSNSTKKSEDFQSAQKSKVFSITDHQSTMDSNRST